MKLKIIDSGEREYPVVVKADTHEILEGVISINYEATNNGRVAVIRLISGIELEADFKEYNDSSSSVQKQ